MCLVISIPPARMSFKEFSIDWIRWLCVTTRNSSSSLISCRNLNKPRLKHCVTLIPCTVACLPGRGRSVRQACHAWQVCQAGGGACGEHATRGT